jgi:hypothetical protein
MARHNRDGKGTDQRGYDYSISYQPDWLRQVKVTRNLKGGRQSTKSLFRNPSNQREALPGERVRTRIVSAAQDIDFEVTVESRDQSVCQVQVTCTLPPKSGRHSGDEIVFTLEQGLLP